MKAMAGEKKQKERLQGTPKKPKTPERALIGSSSTWRGEELERFNVRHGGGVIEAKEALIPEQWFDFAKLQRYQEGISSHCQPLMYSTRSTAIRP